MNNGGSLNSTTINGWRGDVSVRIQVLAYASAVGVATGYVLRRSVVAGVALAAATEGRVWRRSVVTGQALSAPVVLETIWRRVFSPVAAAAQALAVVTSDIRHLRYVRELHAGTALALCTGIVGRVYQRAILLCLAQAPATVSTRVHARSIVAGQARAEAWITTNIDRRIPWDEPAPEHRTFIVPAGTRTFYVS